MHLAVNRVEARVEGGAGIAAEEGLARTCRMALREGLGVPRAALDVEIGAVWDRLKQIDELRLRRVRRCILHLDLGRHALMDVAKVEYLRSDA
eukprot:6192269-Pleurochrysis_carterae.AAC.3